MGPISLIIGMLTTFKAGPFIIVGLISPSDIACLFIISCFSLYLFGRLARSKNAYLLPLNWTACIPFILISVCATGHAVFSNFRGTNFIAFITSILVYVSVYCSIQIYYFRSDWLDRDHIALYFYGILIGLIAPYVANKIGIASDASIYYYPGGRYKGFMPHQNQIGILSTFCFIFFLVQRNRVPKIINLIICAIPLLLSTSKFNFAVCAAALLCYNVFGLPSLHRYFKFIIIFLTGLVAYVFVDDLIRGGVHILNMVNPEGAARLTAFASAPEESETLGARLYIWEQAWVVGSKNLPFGIGPASAPHYLRGLVHAHNAFLNNYLIYGYFGTVFIFAVLAIFLRLILLSRDNIQQRAASFAALGGFASSNMSDSFSNSVALPIMIAIALVVASMSRGRIFGVSSADRRRATAGNPSSFRTRLLKHRTRREVT